MFGLKYHKYPFKIRRGFCRWITENVTLYIRILLMIKLKFSLLLKHLVFFTCSINVWRNAKIFSVTSKLSATFFLSASKTALTTKTAMGADKSASWTATLCKVLWRETIELPESIPIRSQMSCSNEKMCADHKFRIISTLAISSSVGEEKGTIWKFISNNAFYMLFENKK